MRDDRVGGLALITGAACLIVTMAFHPTGHDLFAPGELEAQARLAVAVHALALLSLPLSFLGALALTARLSPPGRLALAALVTFAVAGFAAMGAVIVSGFVAPALVGEAIASAGAARDQWHSLLEYNHLVTQAFAHVHVAAASAALVLWSLAIVRTRVLARGLGIYGLVLGPATVIAVLSHHVPLDVHGMGLVVLAQSVWFIAAGVLLLRAPKQ